MFDLIGPKRYDAPWKDIEAQGWIAPADCTEVRVTLTDAERMAYATAEPGDLQGGQLFHRPTGGCGGDLLFVAGVPGGTIWLIRHSRRRTESRRT